MTIKIDIMYFLTAIWNLKTHLFWSGFVTYFFSFRKTCDDSMTRMTVSRGAPWWVLPAAQLGRPSTRTSHEGGSRGTPFWCGTGSFTMEEDRFNPCCPVGSAKARDVSPGICSDLYRGICLTTFRNKWYSKLLSNVSNLSMLIPWWKWIVAPVWIVWG
jgi:hypothetical protein